MGDIIITCCPKCESGSIRFRKTKRSYFCEKCKHIFRVPAKRERIRPAVKFGGVKVASGKM